MRERKHTTMDVSTGRLHRPWPLLLAALLTLVTAAPALAQGPTLRGTRGESLSESDLTRGATVAVFWASWSPRGQDIVQRVEELHSRWSSRCRVVMVNFQEDRATIDRFLAGQQPSVPVLMDEEGAFAKKYAVTSLPGLVVFKDGQVAFRGKLPEDPNRILSDILQ